MKNTTFRAVALIATALIALLLAAPISFGATNYVLLPAASANQDSGNGADDFHSVMRIQECYGGSLFPQQPIVIRELRFRPSAAVGFAFSATISNIQINLSTSSSQPEALKRAFDDNVGPDGIVGFKGALPMSSAFSGPAGGPKNFDMVVPLTDAFTFDPRKGNLLIDIINRSGSSASYIDAAGGVGDQCGRAWAYGDYPTNVTYTDATVEAVEVFYEVSPPPPPPPAATYDLARDFSTTSNPNGVWTFGWANIGSPLVPFTYFTHDTAGPATVDVWAKPGGYYPAIEKNNSGVVGTSDGGQGTYPPGSVWFYPGQEGTPQNYGMIRFTTPSGGAGTYHLLSDVRSYLNGPSSGDTDFHILKNGAELFGKFLPPSSAASYSGDLVLASGDIIDFIVGRGADDLLYGSGLFINATLNLTSGGGVAPMIATQPQSQTVTAGANVTLTVTANGTAPLSYQWLFNATSISGA